MIKTAKNFDYNIEMDPQDNKWLKGLKFALCYDFKEFFLNDALLVKIQRNCLEYILEM